MLWERSDRKPTKMAVAYYRHSAQDRQENSVEIQSDQVRAFAAANGIEIIKEFSDRGVTGILAEGRDAFNEMIHQYVESGLYKFEYVLVLDVSRWGRFQNSDESAYFTWLCAKHGIQVVFTTIGFPKENDQLLHGLHLSIERYRAASYSRELSGKVWKGCAKIAESGYWAGGSAPFGMCRLLLDEKRVAVQVLGHGEHKAIHNQRVTLAPGDQHDVATIRDIFNAFIADNRSPHEIANELNTEGKTAPGGGQWSPGSIHSILTNEIYAGTMIWNKTSSKMKTKLRINPSTEWVRVADAFEPVVDQSVFQAAQERIVREVEARRRKFSVADMLEKLKRIHDQYGVVTHRLIAAEDDMVSTATYTKRFNSLGWAYQAIFGDAIRERKGQMIEAIRGASLDVRPVDDFWVVDNRFSILIQPIVPVARGYEASWSFHPDQRHDVDLTIGIPLSCSKNLEVLGYLAFPRLMCKRRVNINSRAVESVTLYGHSLESLIDQIMK